MIPLHLRIAGFLSYHDPIDLYFEAVDLACISGHNGAGKSSLLDALTWSLCGETLGKGMDVLIAGMKAPNNYGADYQKTFDAIFPELSEKHGAALYPFFLDGVALNPKLVLADGLHPTAEGVAEIVKRILPQVEALIAKVEARKAAAAH